VSLPTVAGKRAVLEAVRAGLAREVLVANGSRDTEGLREVLEAAEVAGIKIRRVERHELDELAEDNRGVVAKLATQPRLLSERDISSFDFADEALVVVLDGVTDPQNLGAAARVADAAGAQMLITRIKRAAPVTDVAVSASAGALMTLPHARVANISRALERLKDVGFTVAGLDSGAPRTVYSEPKPEGRIAVVVGSEGTGMSRLVAESCDLLVSLPMKGRVASLNAAAGLSAALFSWVVRE
jgi:23S rRNA (guanosine2251-2'-O)-methyltransferase